MSDSPPNNVKQRLFNLLIDQGPLVLLVIAIYSWGEWKNWHQEESLLELLRSDQEAEHQLMIEVKESLDAIEAHLKNQ